MSKEVYTFLLNGFNKEEGFLLWRKTLLAEGKEKKGGK